VRQEYAAREGGELHADGLQALGLDPAALILVQLRDPLAVLRAGGEAARCAARWAPSSSSRGASRRRSI
jgi:protein ImuA